MKGTNVKVSWRACTNGCTNGSQCFGSQGWSREGRHKLKEREWEERDGQGEKEGLACNWMGKGKRQDWHVNWMGKEKRQDWHVNWTGKGKTRD